jgi:agmatinase
VKLPIIQSTFISANAPFATSTAVILGCPFDGTASFRPGARFGPSAIRRGSWGIETYSPYLKRDLSQLRLHDMGDLELPLGEKDLSLTMIREAVRRILSAKKFPILLGGDHLISLPVVEEVLQAYPHLHIVHIDAHTDLRENYLGEVLSHSTVMRKIADCLEKGRLFQIGIRSGAKEEFDLAKKMKSIVPTHPNSLRALVKRIGKQPVYVTFDVDAMDPSLVPGVGTPEPGGLTFDGILSILKELRPLRVVGFDLVELTPDYDTTQVSSVTASVILREMILAFCHR